MNKIYRIVWNHAIGRWMVASELTRARGKRGARRGGALAVALGLAAGAAMAADGESTDACNPAGEQGVAQCVAGGNRVAPMATADELADFISFDDSSDMGVMATPGQLANYIAFGPALVYTTPANAAGNHSIAIGGSSATTGNWSTAFGFNAHVGESGNAIGFSASTGIGGNAMGQSASAAGNYAVAIGFQANAGSAAANSIALGRASVATGVMSTALGSFANAGGTDSVAVGTSAQSLTSDSITLGSQLTNNGQRSVLIGNNYVEIDANSSDAFVVSTSGGSAAAPKTPVVNSRNAVVIQGAASNAANGVAVGWQSTVTAANAMALGTAASATAANAVAIGQDSLADRADAVAFGRAGAERQLVNVAAGTAGTDAVNLAQLNASEQGVRTDMAALSDTLDGAVVYDAADKAAVSFGGTAGTVLKNVAAGDLSTTSTDAVNGSQLHATNARLGTAESSITTVQGNVTQLDGRVTVNEGSITQLTSQVSDLASGGIGLVTHDASTGAVNVAAAQNGTLINVAGSDGDRVVAGVASGRVADDSDEAINGAQLKTTNDRVAGAETSITTLQGNVTQLDGRVTTNEGDITSLTTQVNQLAAGGVGLVTHDATTGVVSIAAAQNGGVINVSGTDGDRVLAGVAEGRVADDSDEAINGTQLKATNDRVASVEGNVSSLDGRVTVNEGNLTQLSQQVTRLADGAVGMVQFDAASDSVAVGSQQGGSRVDMAGAAGDRRIGGVANGSADNDVATIAQLKASGLVDPNDGRALGALVYDDLSLGRATLGGSQGTVIGNLGNGLVAAGSREAVNGGQLYQAQADWESRWAAMDGRVGTVEGRLDAGDVGQPGTGNPGDSGQAGSGQGSVAIGDGSQSSGSGSVAVGSGAGAAGDGAVAIGQGADAGGRNSVAIGAGSSADRDQEVSVGSSGNERVVSNVARGTRATDAVNVGQMEDRFQAERDWSNSRFQAIDKRFDRMGAMSAAYAGMSVNTAGLSGDNRVGAGVGSQNGRTALAVGYQRILGEKKNVSVSLGGAFSGSDQSMSAGAGFSW